jgi:hypothetical protein
MDDQGVPNLEEMDEREAHRFLTDLYSRHIPEEEYNVRHPEDYVMEMPQSGERFRGRENMRAFQEAHPTPPSSYPHFWFPASMTSSAPASCARRISSSIGAR